MSDRHTRNLERDAKQGDPVAAQRLTRARQRAHAPRSWDAACALERDLHATLELLERTVATTQRLRVQGYERGKASWDEAAQAARVRELAQRLSDVIHREGEYALDR